MEQLIQHLPVDGFLEVVDLVGMVMINLQLEVEVLVV